ncbi:16S rRNA (guanine966-N2)-methyltransferase [Alteromonadaceae bacterium Bs31]|nr:16S rRNA (guanine966-N2)-methyltransferase [Alteromonadaceae bacterium Bs31]
MPIHRKKTQKKHASAVRIIGGQWRGRKLEVLDAEGLRPTGDRIRETLFNWLMTEVHGARCLDLFAGTGALGLEALSRGAAHVQFAEFNTGAAARLKHNLEILNCHSGSVYLGDGLQFLGQIEDTYQLIFLDPPFASNLWQQALDIITERQLLSENGLVYIEAPKNKSFIPLGWQCIKQKNSGEVSYGLYQRSHSKENF